MSDTFFGRVGLQQRVLPSYRAAFVDAFASACDGGLSVFAGQPLQDEGIEQVEQLHSAQFVQADNRYLSNPSSPLFICWQTGFISWLEDWQPEALIVEANPRYPLTRSAIGWMHRRGRKVVGWGLGAPALSGSAAALRRLERTSFLRSLDAIIAYSKTGAEQYRQLGFQGERVYIAPNATAPAPLIPPPDRQPTYDQQPTVLFIGRLQARKRVDFLLKACSALPTNLQPHLLIVGEGPARQELTDLAAQVYPNAEFSGAKHGADLEPYFDRADLFVLPGTGGLAIQQAMAHALPVIVARGDGTQDDLVRDENGWQVPPDDLPALTAVLQQALSDPGRLRTLGKASYRIVSEEINIGEMVKVFIRVLNDVS